MFLLPPLVRRQWKHRQTHAYKGAFHRIYCSLASKSSQQQNSRPWSPTRRRDVVKRKVALLVGYDGANYHGLQRNPGVETVADVLEEALHTAGAISDENLGFLEKIKWQVSARTDRGVGAAGNLISAKLLFPRDEHEVGNSFIRTTQRVNACLPDAVRLFGIQYVTSSFSARSACGERWYEYLLPLAALRDSSALDSFQSTLRMFEGSHSFHNFTVGIDHTVPPRAQAMRYIKKSTCDLTPLRLPMYTNGELSETEWVRIQIRGQSFMLNQVRKQVSLAILVHNGMAPSDAIERSLDRRTLCNIPPAPAVGLFLDCCRFDWYNEKHEICLPEPVTLDTFEDAREKFRAMCILPSIARRADTEDALDIYFKTAEAHPVKF